MAAMMLVPSAVLASSIRPGSRVTHDSLNSGSRSKTLCLNEKEKFAERCEITIDETGVKGPAGHITNVVQWTKEQKEFSYGGALAGGIAGGGAGMGAGLGDSGGKAEAEDSATKANTDTVELDANIVKSNPKGGII